MIWEYRRQLDERNKADVQAVIISSQSSRLLLSKKNPFSVNTANSSKTSDFVGPVRRCCQMLNVRCPEQSTRIESKNKHRRNRNGIVKMFELSARRMNKVTPSTARLLAIYKPTPSATHTTLQRVDNCSRRFLQPPVPLAERSDDLHAGVQE